MKLNVLAASAAIVVSELALIGTAHAAIVASDSFTYANGALAGQNGGTGWTGNWATSSPPVVTVASALPGPPPGGDAPMTGGVLSFTGNNDDAATRSLSTISANVWVEFLFQFDSGAINNNDFLGLWLGASSGSHTSVPNMGLKANCGAGVTATTTCTADLFARTTGTGGAFTKDIVIGQTYRLVGHLQKVSSTNYNRFDLWIDPTAAQLSSTSDAFSVGDSGISSFSTIGFRRATTGIDKLYVDNLAFSTGAAPAAPFAAQAPEPQSLALTGLALLVAAGVSRKKKRA